MSANVLPHMQVGRDQTSIVRTEFCRNCCAQNSNLAGQLTINPHYTQNPSMSAIACLRQSGRLLKSLRFVYIASDSHSIDRSRASSALH
jgi:hypothetical protein